MTNPAVSHQGQEPLDLITRLRQRAHMETVESLDPGFEPEIIWEELREISLLLTEAAEALASASASSHPETFTENETKDVLTALYQDGHVDLVLADRVAALMKGPACCAPTPDRTGRTCDKPKGHLGPHWTYGGATMTWDEVCEHGTALDVHCCGCHSGFLFDSRKCTCF